MRTSLTHPSRLASVAVTTLLGLATVACGGNSTEPTSSADTAGAGPVASDPSIQVSDNEFTSSRLTVEVGSPVVWTWGEGSAQHNVIGDGFKSETQTEGTFEYVFDRSGTFTYVCDLHAGMDGTITVVPRQET